MLTEETNGDFDEINILVKLFPPQILNQRYELLESLEKLAGIMDKDYASDPPPPEEASVVSKAKPLMAPLLVKLLSTISQYWRCKCTSPHQAALLLLTHRISPKPESPASFTVLFRHPGASLPFNRWQEARITVFENP